MKSFVEIEITTAEGDYGGEVPCVYATCNRSGDVVGPIWGGEEPSVLRAMATLTEKCTCGADYHARSDQTDHK